MNNVCPACKKDFCYASNLNKHLNNCEIYPEWIKTYVPPKTIDCKGCTSKFTNQLDFDNHLINYCKKN
jgi:hypothetical protein